MKGNNFYLIALTVCIVGFTSCVKDPQDIPGDMIQDPVFGMTGTFGTAAFSIQAAVDDWTVQPLVEDKNNTLRYTSLFSKSGCLVDCTPSLEMSFYRTIDAQGNDEADFLQTIDQGVKSYVKSDAERDSFEISLSTHPALFMTGNSAWISLNDSTQSYQPTFESTTGYDETLHVCFQSFAYTGCHYTQCIYFDPATMVPCLAYLEPKMISANYMSLTVRPEGTPPFLIQWSNVNFPGLNLDSSSSTIILPVIDSSAIYASVNVTDALGNYAQLNQIIRVQNGYIDPCFFPIELSSQQITSSVPSDFADQVAIKWTDDNGQEWRSTYGAQGTNSNLVISNVEYFGLSPAHENTYKVQLSFSVTLYNAVTGEERELIVQDAIIPLSHR